MGNAGTVGNVEVEVRIPTLLRDCTGGNGTVSIGAATLAEALERLRESYPLLRIHLYDETGKLRPHVLIFYNRDSIGWLDRLDVPLKAGDTLEILQAVSGG